MTIWRHKIQKNNLQDLMKDTIGEILGIQIEEINEDSLSMSMPVDHRTKQPYGILHGGASAVLAETLGSVASQLASEEGVVAVGIQLNISHLSSARDGRVVGVCEPVRIGRTLHVWEINIFHEGGKHIARSQLTTFTKPRIRELKSS